MDRLEVFKNLHELELKKAKLENLCNDVSDYYCKGVSISALLNTSAFDSKRKYLDGENVNIDKSHFVRFLNQEIKSVENEITLLLDKLKVDTWM